MEEWISEILLKEEIEKIKNKADLSSHDLVQIGVMERELIILEKLKAFDFNMTGTINQVKERYKYVEVQLLEPGYLKELKRKAAAYDKIKAICE